MITGFILTNAMYILICMVVFIAWAFGYVSTNGLLNKKGDPTRPSEEFNSLNGGSNGTDAMSIEDIQNYNNGSFQTEDNYTQNFETQDSWLNNEDRFSQDPSRFDNHEEKKNLN